MRKRRLHDTHRNEKRGERHSRKRVSETREKTRTVRKEGRRRQRMDREAKKEKDYGGRKIDS